jgi:hypothetical protein
VRLPIQYTVCQAEQSRSHILTPLNITFQSANCYSNHTTGSNSLIAINKPDIDEKNNQLGFEDINLSTDGGIYPELLRNRSFEDADTLQNWKLLNADSTSSASISTADVHSRPPVPQHNPFNRKSLCI